LDGRVIKLAEEATQGGGDTAAEVVGMKQLLGTFLLPEAEGSSP
jgi:hypothetical protein